MHLISSAVNDEMVRIKGFSYLNHYTRYSYCVFNKMNTVMIYSFLTDISGQTVIAPLGAV